MHSAIVTALFFSGLAVSADFVQPNATELSKLLTELYQLPTCATTCVTKGLAITTCDAADFACLCTDPTYISFSETCILSNCTITQSLASQAWQKKACQAPLRDTGPLNRRVGEALLVISGIILTLRFLARWYMQGNSIGWDDWTILLAWVSLIPSTVLVHYMIDYGMGKDIWTVEPSGITSMLRLFYIEQYLYQLAIITTKISIVLLYLRIFPKQVSQRFSYISWAVIAGLLAYLVGFYIYFALECRPLSYFWHQWDGEHKGVCPSNESAIYVNSAFNIFFDIVVFFLPVPKLMSLQVRDTRRKVGVILTFLVGLFVTICSIVRLRYLAAFSQVTNATYHFNNIALWSGLEGDIGVICACIPTIAGPMMYFLREKVGSKLSSSMKSSTGGFKKSANSSRLTGGKSITRLPSTASERGLELGNRVQKHDGIERTTVTSVDHSSSDDDLELGHQNSSLQAKNQWEV